MKTLILTILSLTLIACGQSKSEPGNPLVVTVGDSTVADQKQNNPSQGWGSYLSLDGFEVKNMARSGRSSKSYVEEGHWERVIEMRPTAILIQFGLNDVKSDNRFTDPQGDFKEYLNLYIDDCVRIGALPILVTPVERVNGTSSEPYATSIIEVGKARGVKVIDLHSYSKSVNAGGQLNADNTHPNRDGAELYAKFIESNL